MGHQKSLSLGQSHRRYSCRSIPRAWLPGPGVTAGLPGALGMLAEGAVLPIATATAPKVTWALWGFLLQKTGSGPGFCKTRVPSSVPYKAPT